MTYGSAVVGVSPSTLLKQRGAAALAAAPAAGVSGHDLDLALTLADCGPSGRADPAHDAHTLPLQTWARAVWEDWLPANLLDALVSAANSTLSKAKKPWRAVHGPGSCVVASAVAPSVGSRPRKAVSNPWAGRRLEEQLGLVEAMKV